MQSAFVVLLLLGGSSLSTVLAFPNGLVTPACERMIPNHVVDSMSTPAPFSVISNSSSYVAGQQITVTLQANETGFFKGFLLQARAADAGVGPIGTFSVTGTEAQLLNCSTVASAVSHTSNVNKTTIQATWTAPDNEFRDIEFRATFVQNFSIFWVGVRSSWLAFAGEIPNTTIVVPSSSTAVTLNGTVTPNSSPPLSFSSSILLLLPVMLLTLSNTH
ncbi:putative ferric-chelate reductase 1 [Astyanax mexicanus]|uniref:putative ferric-chelate reductase 1 n=1 Tax=Astyanax mexicanus TaxID=7994 RepID=UPI0020CB005D|nr:putative ferric-chelate reductase 1 [Astyanax mexicanus]